MRILIKGAGVAGLVVAHELSRAGMEVEVAETAQRIGAGASWCAGGMLAPWCERESAEESVLTLGRDAADWWDAALPGHVSRNGTLVVAPLRDAPELDRFAGRTSGYEKACNKTIARLEPALAGRFQRGLFFTDEAHLDPRRALDGLCGKLAGHGVRFHLGVDAQFGGHGRYDRIVDCTGHHRIGRTGSLRGVRGEMLYLRTNEVVLSRPVRLLHPRIPLYIVPRGEGLFMVGATMIESEDAGPVTARSLMELLNAAYALHPAFGEAQVMETATGIRPAFPDNVPRVMEEDGLLVVNGFYRHGFLLAPAMAREAAFLLTSPLMAGATGQGRGRGDPLRACGPNRHLTRRADERPIFGESP